MTQSCRPVPDRSVTVLRWPPHWSPGEPSQQIWHLIFSAAMAVLSYLSAQCPRLSRSHLLALLLSSPYHPTSPFASDNNKKIKYIQQKTSQISVLSSSAAAVCISEFLFWKQNRYVSKKKKNVKGKKNSTCLIKILQWPTEKIQWRHNPRPLKSTAIFLSLTFTVQLQDKLLRLSPNFNV